MMKSLSFFLLLVLATACGQPESNSGNSLEKVIFTTYANETTLLKKQISTCSKSFAEFEKNLSFNIRLDKNLETRTEDFTDLLTGNYLHDGKVISETVYNESVEIMRTGPLQRERLLARGKDVNLCADRDYYDEDTIENAALSASFFIKKTHDQFKSAVPEIYLAPIRLNISPSVLISTVSGKTKYSQYWVDNALYSPNARSIIFLPSTANPIFEATDFWEVPMVASHEYGHHIFNSIYPLANSQTLHSCFGDHQKAVSNDENKNRKITRNTVLSALNEGFADLISHYTLDKAERGIQGVSCLEKTRDVNSRVLYDGKAKRFHREAIRMFFDSPDTYFGTCNYPSFQELHVFGATFAYTADNFMSSLGASREQKLKAIVEWLQFLNANKQKYSSLSPKNYFKMVYSQFITIALTKFNNDFNAVTCAKLEDLAPAVEIEGCKGF